MQIDFPDTPTLNQEFTSGDRTWKWTGSRWESIQIVPAYGNIDGGKADSNFGGTIQTVQGGSAGSF